MKTTHLHNPWNENKPVKIGRDGQVLNYVLDISAVIKKQEQDQNE